MKCLYANKDINFYTHIASVGFYYPLYPEGVHPDNYEAIKESIQEEGMDYPIVAWSCKVHEWEEWANNNEGLLHPPEDLNRDKIVLLVMCGNNRLAIAKELGYTHIESVVKTDKLEASKLCSMMRKDWKKKGH